MNQRQLQQMMKQMGMTQEQLEASEVVIKTPTKEYVFANPEVMKVKMQGQETFQIVGSYETREAKAEVSIGEDDIAMVAEQARVSKEVARKALEEQEGDIAQAIVSAQQSQTE